MPTCWAPRNAGPLAAIVALSLASADAAGQAPQAAGTSVVPIPAAERDLPVIVAGDPIDVPGAVKDLEGPVFLPDGTLLFSDVHGGRIMRLDRAGHVAPVAKLAGLMPGGMALGPDRRLYVVAPNNHGGGAILSMTVDGDDQRVIVPESAGFAPNDLVFDRAGGFYFTDARGGIGAPDGGVWYVAPTGLPLAQIILPGWDAGRNLNLTSLALRLGSTDIAIVTSDGQHAGKATIFHAPAPWRSPLTVSIAHRCMMVGRDCDVSSDFLIPLSGSEVPGRSHWIVVSGESWLNPGRDTMRAAIMNGKHDVQSPTPPSSNPPTS